MACRTFGFCMRPVQGMSGVCCVIELRLGPSYARVARLALFSEMPLMVIVFAVA